jgi:hypothetical protein
MATQAQILANRRNAQKSTGPKTAEGKAAVAKNATRHGLFARYDVVISENPADFDAFREEMLAELAPVGTMESILAERIVSLAWRLKRAERMHNELIDAKIRREMNRTFPELSESLITGKPCDVSTYSDKCYDDQVLGYVAMRDFAGARALERLSMYERRFEASLFRTMAEFKKSKDLRKKEKEVGADPRVCPGRPHGVAPTINAAHRGRDALAAEARREHVEKQSQSGAGQNDLSAFKKREYELLLGAAPPPNKANSTQREAEKRGRRVDTKGQSTEKRRRSEAFVCRY